MKIYTKIIIGLLGALLLLQSCRKSDFTIPSSTETVIDNGAGTGSVTWKSGKTYILDGFVFVNDGQTLTIEPGTIIQAKTGQGQNASSLIVARGAKIIAEGTSDKPIIFTVEGDDLNGSVPLFAKGLWGGLIILGNARLNTSAGEASIEGIPFTEPRGIYGGDNDQDNSGILNYISIRHGGTNIGEGNEINGLTLGGVGSGTIIDHVEIISNKDDGIECFGGCVNLRHIIVSFCGDDCFDFDNGYHGNGQYWIGIQDPNEGDHISEHDGGSDPINGNPNSLPQIFNCTFIGRGPDISNYMILLRENAGGLYANCIFINQGNAINVECNTDIENSYNQFLNGKLEFRNNVFYNLGSDEQEKVFSVYSNQTISVTNQNDSIDAYFELWANQIIDPGITIEENFIELIPMNDLSGNNYSPTDSWFDNVDYKGALGYNNWASGWTLLSQEYF